MTTDTFADFAASQEARKETADLVLTYTLGLCEALKKNYIDFSIRAHNQHFQHDGNAKYHNEQIEKLRKGICDYEFTIETGRKYHKIIMNTRGSRSCHAFVDRKTGGVYKSASWKGPAKGQRYDLLNERDREWLFQYADWSSNYLYRN